VEPLIETIRASLEPDAPPETRAAGVQACRTILTALESTAGQPMAATPPVATSPVASIVRALRGVPPEQLLDLAITKLRAALPPDVQVPPVPPLKFYLPGGR
jgi:hypothetical protein